MKNEKKIKTLAKHLSISIDEINQSNYNDNEFETPDGDYLVLTDEEADEATKNDIQNLVWAFNADFIIKHSKALDNDEASNQIIKAIQDQCENGNDAILKLIDDIDEFIEDAIDTDGRGHFLSGYDGEEIEAGDFFLYRTN